MNKNTYDVLVIGGGPSGSTAALCLARSGHRVAVLEQTPHPRFHIGESFLPRTSAILREIGLGDRVRALPQTEKRGATFLMGDDTELIDFHFRDSIPAGPSETMNLERAPFDECLLQAAREAGAEVYEGQQVRRIRELSDGEVTLECGGEAFRARYVIDASGQSSVIGRHLKIRRTLPDLERVAYFGHFKNVRWRDGALAGYPIVIMCREGWFWLIPIDHERVSIGLVMAANLARDVGAPARSMLAWGIGRCPAIRRMMTDAIGPATNLSLIHI